MKPSLIYNKNLNNLTYKRGENNNIQIKTFFKSDVFFLFFDLNY